MEIRDKVMINTKNAMTMCPWDLIKETFSSLLKIKMEIFHDNSEYINNGFLETPEDIEIAYNEIEKISQSGEFPERFSDNFIKCSTSLKPHLVPFWSYALINQGFVKSLATFIGNERCIEVMAGRGLLSALLINEGVNVICTDSNEWKLSSNELSYTEIEQIEAEEAINKYGSEIKYVIMSWPPMDESSAYRVAKTLRKINSNAKIIYLGEYNGCTADKSFFNYVEEVYDEKFIEVIKSYQTYVGTHDRPYLFG